MQVLAREVGSRRGREIPREIPLVVVFLVGVAAGLILDQEDPTDDYPPVWSGVVHVDGASVAAELLPKGDGYELCATPPGTSQSRCVEVTDSNEIDARLEPASTMDLLIVLSGSDRPFDLADGVEVPFGSHVVQGALVAVNMAGDCVSFLVSDPTGGTSQMSVQRTVYEAQGETVSWSMRPASAAVYEDREACHQLH